MSLPSLTFICEDSGKLKYKAVPFNRLSRLKNARIVRLNEGLQLHAEFKYRGGNWRLAEMGILDVYPSSWKPIFDQIILNIEKEI